MSVTMWMLGLALGDSPEDFALGFVSPETTEAPTDGQIVIEANDDPGAYVVAGPGASLALETVILTGVGSNGRAAILPPPGGWEPLQSYTVGFESSRDEDVRLHFDVGASAAVMVPALEVEPPVVGEWSGEDEHYPWGCCTRTRKVTVDVRMPGAGPWDRVHLVGAFDLGRPSQLTEYEVHTHLWVSVGEGPHAMMLTQWMDEDGTVEPPCFDIVAVSASGEESMSVPLCVDDPYGEPATVSEEAGGGCTSAPSVSAVLGGLGRRR